MEQEAAAAIANLERNKNAPAVVAAAQEAAAAVATAEKKFKKSYTVGAWGQRAKVAAEQKAPAMPKMPVRT